MLLAAGSSLNQTPLCSTRLLSAESDDSVGINPAAGALVDAIILYLGRRKIVRVPVLFP